MPSVGKQELSLARSVGELNNRAQIQDKIAKNANPKPWINSAKRVFEKAKENDIMGDEENAYVFYMRFFNIMQEVMKTTKYQNDKKYFSSLIGRTTLKTAIDQAEKLSTSLTERYKKLEQETKAAIEKERKAKEKEKDEKANLKNMNGLASNPLQDIDDLLNGKKTSTQSSADVYKKLHVNHSSILSPSDKSSDQKDALSQSKAPARASSSPVIDPVVLYQLLNNDPNDVLILDTRSKKEYESSRMSYSSCINIPDDLLQTSVSVGSIERKLPRSTWNQWIERGRKGHIVILDRSTRFKDVQADSKIQCLKDAIHLYDTSCTLKSEPVFLDGGYDAWLWHYPSLVTNPKLPQILPSQDKPEFNLESLSYPELPVLPHSPPTPTANGTSGGQTSTSAPPASVAGTTASTTVPGRISQNVLVKPSTPHIVQKNESISKAEKHAPVTAQPSPNTTPALSRQQLPSQGITQTPHQPPTKTDANPGADVKRVGANDVIHHGGNSPVAPLMPGIPDSHVGAGQNQTTQRQSLPNQQIQPHIMNPGQASRTNNQLPPATSLPSNQSQAATSHPIMPPVPRQSSPNYVSNNTSPVGGPSVAPTQPSPVNNPPPSTITPPPGVQQPFVHPQAPVVPRTPFINNAQPYPTPHVVPQNLPSTPVNPQPSMAQQLRPNVSGILPKMQTKNPSTQQSPSNPPRTTHVPLSPTKPKASIPNVPQTFTSSRTGMTHGLPPGWERVLDRKTGRYFFKDHNTKTTHWNLPESLTQTMNQSILGQTTSTVNEVAPKKPSLKRSLSSPNLAKIDTQETKASLSKDITNRPTVNRRTKPLTESQLAYLAPSSGGMGKALTGLRNLGNSCYMNSVLQCLIATAPLAKYILNSYYLEDINKTNPLGTGGRIAEELAVLTRVAHSGSYRHVSPIEFKRTIGRFASEFGGSKQQDSQEFLLVLLDQFHEDTNRVIKKAYIEEKSNDGLPDAMAAELAWENHKKRNQSVIVELLQGQFKSTLTCSVCAKQSVTFEAFMSLTLPIPTNASCQIEDCIRLFTTREKVSRDNKWFCPRCKQHREAWKTMEIWKLPPILIVHFNRFKRDFDGSWLEKRQTHVHFPSTNLDLSKFVLGPKKSLRYNLYGVSNHYGSMQSGHYTAFCRNIYDRKWYKFDDSDVSSMSESSVKTSAAYILCYTSMEFLKP